MTEDRRTAALQQLLHASSAKRRSAAKTLRKLQDPAAGPELLAALRREMGDPRSWETQYQMIMAIGACGHREALPFLKELAKSELPHAMVPMGLGDALARLSGSTLEGTLSEVLDSKHPLLIEGAFRGVSEASLRPGPETVERMVAYARSLPPTDERGMWARIWLAGCSTVVKVPALEGLLAELKDTDIPQLRIAVDAAARGKRANFNPL